MKQYKIIQVKRVTKIIKKRVNDSECTTKVILKYETAFKIKDRWRIHNNNLRKMQQKEMREWSKVNT